MSREVDLGMRKGAIVLDVDRLIETRLLIQARSGGGKTRTIKKLLEATHGKVQQIVLDIEGEYTALRAKFPYIIAGKGGDIAVNPRVAELLATKILELETSIIIDLYELRQHERIDFVAKFLNAMTNAPKALWHPVMVVIDEAHIFAPEKSHHSPALLPVIDLATRGRKRGFCCVLATQRLSKLHKDVAAECINKMIGGTTIDIDLKRAADEIGFTSKENFSKLKKLQPGHFFVMGPAFSGPYADTNCEAQIGPITTDHAEVGTRGGSTRKGIPVPAPTAAVKAALAKLVDLPKEVEEEAQDRESLRRKIAELERQAVRQGPSAEDLREAHEKGYQAGWSNAVSAGGDLMAGLRHMVLEEVDKFRTNTDSNFLAMQQKLSADHALKMRNMTKSSREQGFIVPNRGTILRGASKKEQAMLAEQRPRSPVSGQPGSGNTTLGKADREILRVLIAWPDRLFSKVQLGAITGYAHGSGNFNNALSRLTTRGFIDRREGSIQLIRDRLSDVKDELGSNGVDRSLFTLDHWLRKLGKCAREIFQIVKDDPDTWFGKEDLARRANYAAGSGNFNNALSQLNTLGLIERKGGGVIFGSQVKELGLH